VLKKSADSNWVILRVLYLNSRGWTRYYCVSHKRERKFEEIWGIELAGGVGDARENRMEEGGSCSPFLVCFFWKGFIMSCCAVLFSKVFFDAEAVRSWAWDCLQGISNGSPKAKADKGRRGDQRQIPSRSLLVVYRRLISISIAPYPYRLFVSYDVPCVPWLPWCLTG
jgi:hypothetical protein